MSKKILLADDSITIQKVVELTFSDGDYEVIATNNGTKAIEEIPKVKPDIILSDIIMPEKNGYELCEWVKSHPEYRHIPVILLTGTFEPFDPDRAEKAGCDAVVTKPFESQSLIQKVEELIGRASASAPLAGTAGLADDVLPADEEAPDAFAPEAPDFPEETTPQDDEPMMAESEPEPASSILPPPSFEMEEPGSGESSPFEGMESEARTTSFPPLEEEPKPQGEVFDHAVPPADEMDEDSSTRLIPKMSMEDIQRLREKPQAEPEEPPAFEQPAPESEELPPLPSTSAPEEAEPSPFEAPAEEPAIEDDATRIIPKLSMDDIQRLHQEQQAESSAEPAPFGEEQALEEPRGEEPPPFEYGEPSAPTDEGYQPPSFAPEEPPEEFDDSATRMIPKMAFEDVERMQQESEPEAEEERQQFDQPEMAGAPAFGMGVPGPAEGEGAVNPFAAEAEAEEKVETEESFESQTEQPSAFSEPEPEPLSPSTDLPEEPVQESREPELGAGAAQGEEGVTAGTLSDEQVERIARRVVELLSDKTIREIAWEVIPETAEMIVRERIRELEGEES